MFWNVFRPGNFSQKWIFYDEKTEKLIFFLSIFKNRVRLDIKLEVRLEVRLG